MSKIFIFTTEKNLCILLGQVFVMINSYLKFIFLDHHRQHRLYPSSGSSQNIQVLIAIKLKRKVNVILSQSFVDKIINCPPFFWLKHVVHLV